MVTVFFHAFDIGFERPCSQDLYKEGRGILFSPAFVAAIVLPYILHNFR